MKKFIGLFSALMLLPVLAYGWGAERHMHFKQIGHGCTKKSEAWDSNEVNLTKNGEYCGVVCMGDFGEAGCPILNQHNKPSSRSLTVVKAKKDGKKLKPKFPKGRSTYYIQLDQDILDTAKITRYPVSFLLKAEGENYSSKEGSWETKVKGPKIKSKFAKKKILRNVKKNSISEEGKSEKAVMPNTNLNASAPSSIAAPAFQTQAAPAVVAPTSMPSSILAATPAPAMEVASQAPAAAAAPVSSGTTTLAAAPVSSSITTLAPATVTGPTSIMAAPAPAPTAAK